MGILDKDNWQKKREKFGQFIFKKIFFKIQGNLTCFIHRKTLPSKP